MTNLEIFEVVSRIEHSIPTEEAVAKFRAFGEVALYANRAGYVRIAVEMLKCAIGEAGDLNDLFNHDSDFGIEHMVTTEDQLNFLCK
jgi:hypothetical protein